MSNKEIKVFELPNVSYSKPAVDLPNVRGEHVELHFHTQEGDIWHGDVLSETKVLRSAAGYFIGHEYQDRDFEGMWMPYDRISGYYATRSAAETDLEHYRKALGH